MTDRAATKPRSRRRDEILGVAAELFAEKGFEGTTVRDIADTAGILSGSLYHHFRSKEQIMEEIFAAYFDEAEARWAAVLASEADPAEQFRAMLRELLLAVDRHPGAARILTNEWARLRGIGNLETRWKDLEHQSRSMIDAAVAAGSFRSDIEPFYLYSVGMDVVRGFTGWYRRDSRVDIEAVAEAYVSLVFDGLTGPDRPA
ncbi:MAG TPA: TetR/AcrR family transcriptional regulator [Iamia sp.]|nr:TetR/AcrR family transcriptional regulator [Iamia sp.]